MASVTGGARSFNRTHRVKAGGRPSSLSARVEANRNERRYRWANAAGEARKFSCRLRAGALKEPSGDLEGLSADEWKDEFSDLGDRKNAEAMALPQVTKRKRVILVRHGQSTVSPRISAASRGGPNFFLFRSLTLSLSLKVER